MRMRARLRTSGSSGSEGVTKSAWFLYPAPAFPNGQPMPLVPIDLGEFDLYPQLNAQGIPSTIATDMSQQRIVLSTSASLTAGSTSGRAAEGRFAEGPSTGARAEARAEPEASRRAG